MNAGPDVQRFMREFDETGLPYSLNPSTAQIVDAAGNVITTMESQKWSTDWSTLYYRLRANFDGLHSRYCEVPPEFEGRFIALYMDGHSMSDIKNEDGKLTVEFYNSVGSTGTLEADMVIAADGPSSRVRQIMIPQVERKYVGYCGWWGTVPENEVSDEAKKAFNERITVCSIEKSFLTSLVLDWHNLDNKF